MLTPMATNVDVARGRLYYITVNLRYRAIVSARSWPVRVLSIAEGGGDEVTLRGMERFLLECVVSGG